MSFFEKIQHKPTLTGSIRVEITGTYLQIPKTLAEYVYIYIFI